MYEESGFCFCKFLLIGVSVRAKESRGNRQIGNLVIYRSIQGHKERHEFSETAKGMNGSLVQASDEAIESLFYEAAKEYWTGEKTKARALDDFKRNARAYY